MDLIEHRNRAALSIIGTYAPAFERRFAAARFYEGTDREGMKASLRDADKDGRRGRRKRGR